MPEEIPQEVVPLVRRAFDLAPDAPGPFVWLYPFDEYADMTSGPAPRPDLPFTEDFFLGEALQQGFPLNTVVSTGNFRRLMELDGAALAGAILLIPVAATTGGCLPAIREFLRRGGSTIFYGALDYAPSELRQSFAELRRVRQFSLKNPT